jgi:S-adenosylmethionine decarboxylase
MFPDRQPGPHRSWEEEVKYLDGHFGKLYGGRVLI